MRVRNLNKLPKRKVTVDDLLGFDTIVDIAGDLVDDKENIEELVVIFTHRGENSVSWYGNGLSKSRISWLMDCVKCGLMGD